MLQLTPDDITETTIQFEPGVQASGFVRDESGAPIPGTQLFVGPIANPVSFRIRTDEDGKYTVHGLPAGNSVFKIFHEEYEELNAQLTLRADTVNQNDFTLHQLQKVQGTVVDERGAPLKRWYVAVESGRGIWSAGSWTNENGNFHIVGIPDGATDLMVTSEDYRGSATRFAIPSVIPAAAPIRIVVPDSAVPSSSIRMDVVVDGKPAPAETKVRLRSASPLTHRDVHPAADGSVLFESLASRQFHLEISLDGFAPAHRTFFLGVTEELDLGKLELTRGGTVRVELQGSDAPATAQVIDVRGRILQSFEVRGGQGTSPPLPNGPAILRLRSDSGATQFLTAKVALGETTVARFIGKPGLQRTIQWTRPGGAQARFRTTATVTDAQGSIHFHSEDLRRSQTGESADQIELSGLQPGSYRLQIQDPSGATHDSWITVDRSNSDALQVQLDW